MVLIKQILRIIACLCFLVPSIQAEASQYALGYIAHYAKYTQSRLDVYAEEYDVLAVTGYAVSAGKPVRIVNSKLHTLFKQRYKSVFLPVLTLASASNGMRLLKSEKLRNVCAENIVLFLQKNGLKRVQFDFEYIPSAYNNEYAQLLSEVKKKPPSIYISVCIAPQVDTVPKYAGFFDVRTLTSYSDEFMLMSYDYYGPLRKHGPVTDIEWTEKNIKYLLKYIPPEKLVLGAPLYGYWWDSSGKEHVFTERQFYRKFPESQIVRMKEGTVTLKDVKDTRYRNLSVGDSTTVKLFEAIAEKYKLKGTAIWRLGFER